MSFEFVDREGYPLRPGRYVVTDDGPARRSNTGVVVSLREPDGDVDDEGYMMLVAPEAAVRFYCGPDDAYVGTIRGFGSDRVIFDDLLVVARPSLVRRALWRLIPRAVGAWR